MSVSEGNLVCPKCQGKTMVKDSRPNQAGTAIRRRRMCFECQHRFTTFEVTIEESLTAGGVRSMLATAREAMRNLEVATKDAGAILDAIEKTQSVLSGELVR